MTKTRAMTQAIIFDLDGTLADSIPCVVMAGHRAAQRCGLSPVPDADIRARVGQPLDHMLGAIYGVEGGQLDALCEAYREAYLAGVEHHEVTFPGALELLLALRASGHRLAVCTGKGQTGAERATGRMGIAPLVDTVHGILPGTPGKPHPAVLGRTLKALGVGPAAAVMVGDTTFDLHMAASMGVPSVGVAWGVHPVEALAACGPRAIASSMDELGEILLSWRAS